MDLKPGSLQPKPRHLKFPRGPLHLKAPLSGSLSWHSESPASLSGNYALASGTQAWCSVSQALPSGAQGWPLRLKPCSLLIMFVSYSPFRYILVCKQLQKICSLQLNPGFLQFKPRSLHLMPGSLHLMRGSLILKPGTLQLKPSCLQLKFGSPPLIPGYRSTNQGTPMKLEVLLLAHRKSITKEALDMQVEYRSRNRLPWTQKHPGICSGGQLRPRIRLPWL